MEEAFFFFRLDKMPAEVLNWGYQDPDYIFSEAGRRSGVLKNTNNNVRGLTRGLYDESRASHSNQRDRQWLKLGFGVPAADESNCATVANGAIYNKQYYPSGKRAVQLESHLQRRGTNKSLVELEGFNGPQGFGITCATSILGGPLLADFTFNDGRSTLNANYQDGFDRFRTVDDKAPFIHSFPYRQSVSESIGDPARQALLSQNEIRNLYPVLKNPGQSASKSAYALA